MQIKETKAPFEKPEEGHTYIFGKIFTDHMLEIDWSQENGWERPAINPFHNLELSPANSTLHYALE